MSLHSGCEYRIFGPPGTGKTTYLQRQVEHLYQFVGADVMVCSLTRTAAAEIAGRRLPIPRDHVGTLHSMAYRSLDRPALVETREMIQAWNTERPQYRLGESDQTLDDSYPERYDSQSAGDNLMSRYKILRHRMVPRESWPADVLAFASAWESWKHDNAGVDYADMLEIALSDVDTAPGAPRVILADEAQDFSRLGMSLLRKWGRSCDALYLAGDDDQCLYHWAGATADAFLTPAVDDRHKYVLSQSYRLPRQIHALAQRWVEQLSYREDKAYQPRDADGVVERAEHITYAHPEPMIELIQRDCESGQTVMILATCGYMLEPTIACLRQAGIPFHNPYRVTRGDWNPLVRGAATRIAAYLRPQHSAYGPQARLWTYDELWQWIEHLTATSSVRRGGKQRASGMRGTAGEAAIDALMEILTDEAFMHAIEGDIDWYEQSLLTSHREQYAYALRVYRTHGIRGITEPPRLIVGTIHSVKGGEADTVYLFPDLSRSGFIEWANSRTRDGVIRAIYVGLTRARERLVICGPATRLHVQIA